MMTAFQFILIPTGGIIVQVKAILRSPGTYNSVVAYLVYPGGNIIGHDDSFVFGSYGRK